MAVLNGLKNLAPSKRASELKNRPVPVRRLVRFCKENGLKDEELILDAVKAQQITREASERTSQDISHEDRSLHRNPAWPIDPPPPLTIDGETQNGEIILLQIGHYFESYLFSQRGQGYLSQPGHGSPMSSAKDWAELRIFHRMPPSNPNSVWNLIDFGQYSLHIGEIQLGFGILDFACGRVRQLLIEQCPLLIPHLVSIFANDLSYWSNLESQSRLHDFVLEMAAVVLGDIHPVTVIIKLLKNLHHFDIFMLSWQRVLDLLSDKLGICHRRTAEAAEAFSSALHRPSYPGHARPQGKYPIGMREHWSRETVFLALDNYSQELQALLSSILEEKDGGETFWILAEISESLRLLRHILVSNEEIMDPRQQWLRHDTKLRFLLLCNQMYGLLDFPTAGDRCRAEQALSFDNSPETVLARRQRTQTVFCCLHLTWTELDQEQEAARLKATFPMAFEDDCS